MTRYYALIYPAGGPYEEIFVLTFKAYGLNSHLTSLQCACRLKAFFEKFLFSCVVGASCSQLMAVSFRAISCLACQTVLRPRSRLVDFNNAGINLTGYYPPPPPGQPGTFASKCVPSPRAFTQQKMPGGRANKWRCPWGRAFASTSRVLTQSSGLKIKLSERPICLAKSRRLRKLCQTAYLLSAHISAL